MNTTSRSLQERNFVPTRHGNHATIYGVRHDPKLANKNIITSNEEKGFPFIGATTYRGDWFDNKKSGFGTQINKDGSKYEGEFRENLYHGSGTLWIKRDQKNVKEYSGNWEKGKRGGLGTLYVENGDVYTGEWRANKRSGEGRLDNPNGDYFIGNWHNNVRNGYGTMHYKNGNIFEGDYKDGMKSGFGRYFYATTRKVYEGEWSSDAPRCGEYRDPTTDEEIKFKDQKVSIQRFQLPILGLLDSKDTTDDTKRKSRILNVAGKGLQVARIHSESTSSPPMVLSKERISRAAIAFCALNSSEEGLIPLNALKPVFSELGSDLSEDDMEAIAMELDIDMGTLLSFTEVADIAAYLSTIAQNSQQKAADFTK